MLEVNIKEKRYMVKCCCTWIPSALERTDNIGTSCDYQINIKLSAVFDNVCTSTNLFLSNKEHSYTLIKYINNHLDRRTVIFYFSTEQTKYLQNFSRCSLCNAPFPKTTQATQYKHIHCWQAMIWPHDHPACISGISYVRPNYQRQLDKVFHIIQKKVHMPKL